MKFQIGDKVLLVYSKEIGFIENRINEEMFLINVDGVSFPVHEDQLEHPYLDTFLKQPKTDKVIKLSLQDIPKEKAQAKQLHEPLGVGLNVLPIFKQTETEDEVDILKFSLFNNTNDDFNFDYVYVKNEQAEISLQSALHSNTVFYLHDIDFEVLNDKPFFEFEFSLIKPDKKKAAYYFYELKLKPKQLFANIQKVRMGEIASFNILLFETYPDKKEPYPVFELPFNTEVAKQKLKEKKSQPYFNRVIDLHIENIDASAKSLSNSEIITIQLSAFEKFLDTAMQHREKYLIAIHGIGEGTLRENIHSLLKHYPQVKTFVNQYHPLYGFGATEIYLN